MVYLLVILDVQTVTHPFKRETNNEENLGSNFFHEFYLRFKKTHRYLYSSLHVAELYIAVQ